MSDEDDWDFAGADDAQMTIRAAVRYLLKSADASDRGDILVEIIEIVRQAAHDNMTYRLTNPIHSMTRQADRGAARR